MSVRKWERGRAGAAVAIVTLAALLPAAARPAAGAAPEPLPDPGARAVPASSSAAAADTLAFGKAQFEAICSACHGANARGGRNGAPDLLVSEVAQSGAVRFREFVRAGSPARGMPPFALDDRTLDAMHAHVESLAVAARRRGDREIAVVGDPARGRAYFEGSGGCSTCHSAEGDMKGIGARYTPRVLQGRIVLPRGVGVHPGLLALGVRIPGVTDRAPIATDSPRTVTVTLASGARVSGALVAISDFDVALREADGTYRSFTRRGASPRVELHDPAQPHVERLAKWSDRDLHDVTAWLVTLK